MFNMKCLRRGLGVNVVDQIRNQSMRERSGNRNVEAIETEYTEVF